GAGLAEVREMAARGHPGAVAVTVPLGEDEGWAGHQVEHGGENVTIEPRRRVLAEFGKPALVWRPQAMHHKREPPLAAFGLAGRALRRSLGGGIAERRRPRQ